jgi:hypothetical protein
MSRLFPCVAPALVLAATLAAAADDPPLPTVTGVSFESLREQGEKLVTALDDLRAPLPRETRQELKEVFKQGGQRPEEAAQKIQRLLDPFCLITVSINPESRVKAARGPAPATLALNRKSFFLIKVVNEGGVTHGLGISGPQLWSKAAVKGWLEATVESYASGQRKLTGQKLEYVLLALRAHEKGQREVTLKFDVGQGTQDLGFRAEVPVLFAVR